MTTKNDGGAAFPSSDIHIGKVATAKVTREGMSLRDWFAGQALVWAGKTCDKFGNTDNPRTYAEYAYRVADAMLAERERKDDEG